HAASAGTAALSTSAARTFTRQRDARLPIWRGEMTRSIKRRLACTSAFGVVFLASMQASAWKPKTHVYLAKRAYDEAYTAGKVAIYATNYAQGTVTPTKIGDFEVDPVLLRALRGNPEKYYAGVIGPDAYPDILTGQMRIHPPGAHDASCNSPD